MQAKRTGTLRVKIMLTELRIELIWNSCQMYIQLMSCYTRYVCARSSSHILSYNCAYILISENNSLYHQYTEPSCCSSSSRLCTHAHTIKLYHIYIPYVINMFCIVGWYSVDFYLLCTGTGLQLVMQTVV